MDTTSSLVYSKYRFDRAKEDLAASKFLFDNNWINASVNRSYYAIFHALRAVTVLDGFESKKHSGVISYFNRFYVKTKIFDASTSKLIESAFDTRSYADY